MASTISRIFTHEDERGDTLFVNVTLTMAEEDVIETIAVQLSDAVNSWAGSVNRAYVDANHGHFQTIHHSHTHMKNAVLSVSTPENTKYSLEFGGTPTDEKREITLLLNSTDGVCVVIGVITVHRTEWNVKQMLSQLIVANHKLTNEVRQKDERVLQLERDRTDALKIASEANDKATMLETTVFTKFAAVLNAKKRKIAELMNEHLICERSPPPLLSKLASERSEGVDVEDNGADTDTEREMIDERRELVAKARRHSMKDTSAVTAVDNEKQKRTTKRANDTPASTRRSTRATDNKSASQSMGSSLGIK